MKFKYLTERVLAVTFTDEGEVDLITGDSPDGYKYLLDEYEILRGFLLDDGNIIVWKSNKPLEHIDAAGLKEMRGLLEKVTLTFYVMDSLQQIGYPSDQTPASKITNILHYSVSSLVDQQEGSFYKGYFPNARGEYSSLKVKQLLSHMPFLNWMIFRDGLYDCRKRKFYRTVFDSDWTSIINNLFNRYKELEVR